LPEQREVDRIIQPRMAFPDDGEPYEIGWDRPKAFPDRLRPVAEDALASLNAELTPASDGALRKWLSSLAVLVAGGRSTADDAQIKLNAYAAMLEGTLPVCAFTRDTLDKAARKFKFLPSYAELTEFLSAVVSPKTARANRLAYVLKLPPPEPPRQPPTQAEIDRVSKLVSDAVAARSLRGVAPCPDYEREDKAKAYTKAIERWSNDGRQGPPPKAEDFGLEARAA
jgi:hypothetical protein